MEGFCGTKQAMQNGYEFGTQNVRGLYSTGSLQTAASKLAKYSLELVVAQDVRKVQGGGHPAYDHTAFCANGNAGHHLGTGFFIHNGIILEVERIEVISDMSYITLRNCWSHITVLYVHTPNEVKSNDKDTLYKELQHAFHLFPKYHMKTLLGTFNAVVDRTDIFKSIIGNDSLHEISNDNGVRATNFATSKNLIVKSTMFQNCNMHKYNWSPDGKAHTQTNHVLKGKR